MYFDLYYCINYVLKFFENCENYCLFLANKCGLLFCFKQKYFCCFIDNIQISVLSSLEYLSILCILYCHFLLCIFSLSKYTIMSFCKHVVSKVSLFPCSVK